MLCPPMIPPTCAKCGNQGKQMVIKEICQGCHEIHCIQCFAKRLGKDLTDKIYCSLCRNDLPHSEE